MHPAQKRWIENNPEKVREHGRRTDARPERRRAMMERTKARSKRETREMTTDDHFYRTVVRRDICSYCTGPGREADHIEASGSLGWENMTGACRSCNASKGKRSLLAFLNYRLTRQGGNRWMTTPSPPS